MASWTATHTTKDFQDLEKFNPEDWKKDIVGGRIICVAIDGSDDGSKAFYWALNNLIKPSTGINNKLVLMTCIAADAPEPKALEAQALLKKYIDLVRTANVTVPLRATLLKGDVRVQLCDVAAEVLADVFVIGTRGLGSLKRAVLGSVSDYDLQVVQFLHPMSFSWDAVEQRTRLKQESDKALKEYLLHQQAETKNRKLAEKQNDIAEYQRSTGIIGTNLAPRSTNAAPFADPRSFYPPPPTQPPQSNGLQLAPAAGPRFSPTPPPIPRGDYSSSYKLSSSDIIAQPASLDQALISPTSLITQDFLSKLRFAEEQLENERRSRTWLETELQLSKAQLATLTAKVDKLADQAAADNLDRKELQRIVIDHERRAAAVGQEMKMGWEKGYMKLQTIVSELVARQRSIEGRETEEGERIRHLSDELNSLRFRVEGFGLLANEVGNEVKAKTREWEVEAGRGSEVMRVVRDHESALGALHQSIDANTDSLSKKLEMSLLEIRQRVDAESRARFQFENGMRELFSEVKKCVSNQDREMMERIEGARQQAGVAFDRERMERERGLTGVMEDVRLLERGVKEIVNVAMDKLGSQVGGIEDTVQAERQARSKFEQSVKAEVEEGFKLIQHAVLKKFEELQLMQVEVRQSVGNAVKALKESILLVERTTDQKMGSVEEVLRAEIRSRMETDRVVGEVRKEMEAAALATERRAMTAISQAVEEARETSTKIEEELKVTAEQLIAAKTRSIDDLENQMELLRKRIIESDAETNSKVRIAHLAAEQLGRTAQASLEVFETRVEAKFSAENEKLDELHGKIKLLEDQSEYTKSEIEDKLNFRSLQTESTMAAFKEELELRVTKSDVADLETKLEASVAAVKSNVTAIGLSLQVTRDDMEQKPSKKDLDDAETRLKAHFAAITLRVGEIDQTILQIKESLSDKLNRKELDDHETNLKTAILNLELKSLSTTEYLENVKLEMLEKAGKKSLQDQDDRIKNYMMELDTKGMEIEENLRSIKDAIGMRVTRLELEDIEKKLSDLVAGVQDRMGEISASVAEAKTEISQTMHDDVEEMVASINGALDAVQARADKIDNSVEGMKLRLSEAENSSRSRIQLFTNSVETMVADNTIAIDKAKELCLQQIKDVSEKVDVLPKQIQANEAGLEEFKKRVMEVVRVETERLNSGLEDVRGSLGTKVSEATLEQLQGEVTKNLHRLTAQQEIEAMAIETMKVKVSDAEAFSRDSMREFRAGLEKSADEQASAIRAWRDSYSKRFEELDGRTMMIPKMLDQTWAELRKIRFDIDERIRNELSHLEKDLTMTKGEMATKVSNKNLDSAVSITVSPFNSRLDRLNHDIDELRALTAKLQGEISGKLYSGYGEFSNISSGVNYHKPQLFAPTRSGPDPNLERIADNAESKRPSSEPEKEEY
ncbi:hypothetical protein BCR33DRAFT_769879 [Rhizoclosmatium globosum]|uniref:UspA domain-containing protein n=1 Tax=Rhizoclosmatium globosum TaxID=329046 RepID=A0A1Y2BR62_9FUNG|nr:hypothetical protein BCR33DRAFT_769879 [Rhizoclosmatium globosum]|eukprot:ORY37236.1 hypothetical protein BCR33DRAFT_769879 [Rhizoclosmatium globosum]